MTPLGAIARGLVAGAAGTLAMDLLWYRRYRAGGGEDGFVDWEFAATTKSYEDAGAPAQVGRRVVEGVLDQELPPDSAGRTTNIVHWLTGLGWGAQHGLMAGSVPARKRPLMGLLTGVLAWAGSYAVLAPAGLYAPPWEYDRDALGKDLTAHLVFGLGTGLTFWALAPGDASRGGDSNP